MTMKLQLFAGEEAADAVTPVEEVPVQEEPVQPQVDAGLVRQHWNAVDRIYGAWMGQAEQVKQLFPDFNLAEEMKNPSFARLLRAGVDIPTAHQAMHGQEILPAAMAYAARQMERAMADAFRSGCGRPAENGLQGGGAVLAGGTVAGMSRQDYARICRMVERGERVSFG